MSRTAVVEHFRDDFGSAGEIMREAREDIAPEIARVYGRDYQEFCIEDRWRFGIYRGEPGKCGVTVEEGQVVTRLFAKDQTASCAVVLSPMASFDISGEKMLRVRWRMDRRFPGNADAEVRNLYRWRELMVLPGEEPITNFPTLFKPGRPFTASGLAAIVRVDQARCLARQYGSSVGLTRLMPVGSDRRAFRREAGLGRFEMCLTAERMSVEEEGHLHFDVPLAAPLGFTRCQVAFFHLLGAQSNELPRGPRPDEGHWDDVEIEVVSRGQG